MISIILLFLLLTGVTVYFVRPQYFFLYWLSIQPYILPVFFILFKDNMLPFEENYLPRLYFRYSNTFSGLILLLFCVSFARNNKWIKSLKVISIPFIFLLLFVLLQLFYNGFNLNSLYWNIISICWNIAPLILLVIDKKVRPDRASVIHFVIIFVSVQLFFSILNLIGFRIYGEVSGIFDDSLIAGTFTRYNHMANYLAIFFYILSNEYYECRKLNILTYLLLTLVIGLLIIISGSRMTLILFVFTAIYYFFIYHGKKVALLSFLGIVSLFYIYIIGNESFYGQEANEGTGLERNLIGIINLANTDDLSEGSTMYYSAYLLFEKFNSPLFGNGLAYRNTDFYGHPTEVHNEDNYRTDARLAFMLVEYGVIGLCLFFLLFVSMFRCCYLFSEENDKRIYWGAFVFFLLFSITDNGFWDYVIFSVLFIYVFSQKRSLKTNIVKKTLINVY